MKEVKAKKKKINSELTYFSVQNQSSEQMRFDSREGENTAHKEFK